MMEEENVVRPHQEIAALSLDEKKYLLAVERGDVASTRRILEKAEAEGHININCVDPLGRSALLMAIDNENLEMVELLINHKMDTKDALLHAISEEFVEAVEVLLDHEDSCHKNGDPHSWEALPPDTATFTPDITPLILAAHRDNYEIIKILLDRGATLPMPHDVSDNVSAPFEIETEDICARCAVCPPYILYNGTIFDDENSQLSGVGDHCLLQHYAFVSLERISGAAEAVPGFCLRTAGSHKFFPNHDPTGPAFEHGDRMHLNRLKLAVKLRQKKFVSHPNVQQLLASIWYEGLPGFRRKNMALQALEIVRIVLLMLASQRIETVIGGVWGAEMSSHDEVPTKRGASPTLVEWLILAWVSGVRERYVECDRFRDQREVKQLWDVGLQEYVNDMWNVIDFVTNSLYVATVALRVVSYFEIWPVPAGHAESVP
ncbi:hypothetical protein RP20_CCG001374 [Aedes albopictus]|nr:hypothetical protein RP20_CCG001374 [Aedes albopictus]